MMRHSFLSLLATGCAAFATGCSSPQGSSAPAAGTESAAPTAAVQRGPGTRAYSLGGIPGHQFGEPLSAFPGLKLNSVQTPGSKTYIYPEGKGEPGWFGKRKKEAPGDYFSFYYFKDGRFAGFQAITFREARTALRAQAVFLFGQGKLWPNGNGTSWDGQQVQAEVVG